MITYSSTRGDEKEYTFSEAIVKGIADDGGLLVPDHFPLLSAEKMKTLVNASYTEIAEYVFSVFETDFSDSELKKCITQAYGEAFDSKDITPVTPLDKGTYLLELWHGPTSAFKDIALQLMPLLFVEAIKKQKSEKKYLILVATSGDTGKAALEGYKDLDNIAIIVTYPKGKTSLLQQLQMQTQEGSNVSVLSVKGDFDDCQRIVKEVFSDTAYNKELLSKHKTILSSANSINWGRLMPQIVYYLSSYLYLVREGKITYGDEVDFSVPTGNFGNILAGYIAQKMGLPVRKFICASNENNVLTDFITSGTYDISQRKLVMTPSPSMDILIASNLERLLYFLTNDTKQVTDWMSELREHKKFTIDEKTKEKLTDSFFAGWVSNADSLNEIATTFKEKEYLLDPHTAIALVIGKEWKKDKTPLIICATAHWAKFSKDVYKAIGLTSQKNEFAQLEEIKKRSIKLNVPQALADLVKKEVLHTNECKAEKAELEEYISRFLEKNSL